MQKKRTICELSAVAMMINLGPMVLSAADTHPSHLRVIQDRRHQWTCTVCELVLNGGKPLSITWRRLRG